jgi:uncharacterized protein YjbI with pentapeptide repeats
MKLSTPSLPARLETATLQELLDGSLEDMLLEDVDATNCSVTALDLSGVKLERVFLTAAQCERVSARDVIVKGSDFSAANFSNGVWNRAEFTNCRMSGVDFSKASLHDVTFKSCRLDMANFRFADLRRVKFIDCTMTEVDFLGARLVDATFEMSDLEKAVFETASCTRVDLRTSQLTDLVGWKSLKGATIDSVQLAAIAPYLANELGIAVR